MMSQLIVIGYETEHQAEEVRMKLIKLQQEYLIDLEDAVVAVKKQNGKVKLNQAVDLTAVGIVEGTFWGMLIGLIFMNPLLGATLGGASGAISGALTDVGINDNFMKEVASHLQPGTSALFVLVRSATPDKVAAELANTGGKVIQTSLSHADEAKLQAVINEVKASPQSV
jgi:uncharacterized membrane protein